MEREILLKVVNNDIKFLRHLMYETNKKVENLSDPLLVQISQMLDMKLNQHQYLIRVEREQINR